MSDLEVRELRYFVAVAEELHFGRAAERLGMAQPPLSRAIRDLERRLAVRLLDRTTRRVVLTPAGEVLLREARTALDAVAAAGQRARHAGRLAPSLRLALKADYDAGLLPRILAAYERDPVALPVEPVLGGRGEQAQALRDGRADVGLLATPFDDRGLDFEPLLTEPCLLAIAASDPLAARSTLRLSDLAGRVLPDGSPAEFGGVRQRTGEIRDFVADPAPGTDDDARRGTSAPAVRPDDRRAPLDLAQIFSLIELGSIVWFPPISVAHRHQRPAIAYRTVTDLRPTTFTVAWPQDSSSPAVAAFVRAACAVAAEAVAERSGDGGQALRSEPLRT